MAPAPSNPAVWAEQEDEYLRELVREHGQKKWSLIASLLKTKGSKQCRRRWKNFLNAELKQGGWSAEEDRILMEGHKRYGNKWTEIAKLVGGRTDNAVKNRWAALCKRTQPRGGGGGAAGSKPSRAAAGAKGKARRPAHRSTSSDDSDSEDDSEDDSGGGADDDPPARSPRSSTYGAAPLPRHHMGAAPELDAMQQPLTHKHLHHNHLHHQHQLMFSVGGSGAGDFFGAAGGVGVLGKRAHGSPPPATQAHVKRLQLDPAPALQGAALQGLQMGSGGGPLAQGAQQQAEAAPQGGGGLYRRPMALDLAAPHSPRPSSRKHSVGGGIASPRTAAVFAASGMPEALEGLPAARGHLLAAAAREGSAPLTPSRHRGRADGSGCGSSPRDAASYALQPGFGGGAGGRKAKPELRLVIPKGGVGPPRATHLHGGLQIHVAKELLSPAEVRFAQELNAMHGAPLHISLEGRAGGVGSDDDDGSDAFLEPPLSTSRRAAEDALTALVAGDDSPLAGGCGLGPLTLGVLGPGDGHGGGQQGGGAPAGLEGLGALPGVGAGAAAGLMRWLQHGCVAARGSQGGGEGGGGGGGGGGVGGEGAGPPEAKAEGGAVPLTGEAQPEAPSASVEEGAEGGSAEQAAGNEGGGALAAPEAGQGDGSLLGVEGGVLQHPPLHEGHRQLLSKLLQQARASSGASPGATACAAGARGGPRLAAAGGGHSPHRPWHAEHAQPQQRSRHGNGVCVGHVLALPPARAAAAAVGVLPGSEGGGGPGLRAAGQLGGGDAAAVEVSPPISSQDFDQLLGMLGAS